MEDRSIQKDINNMTDKKTDTLQDGGLVSLSLCQKCDIVGVLKPDHPPYTDYFGYFSCFSDATQQNRYYEEGN